MFYKMDTPSQVSKALHEGIKTWLNLAKVEEEDFKQDYDPVVQSAISEQWKLGWKAFLRGHVASSWNVATDHWQSPSR